MLSALDAPRFFASEFPNDNPALHDGAIWVCFAECGPLRAVVRPLSRTIPASVTANEAFIEARPVEQTFTETTLAADSDVRESAPTRNQGDLAPRSFAFGELLPPPPAAGSLRSHSSALDSRHRERLPRRCGTTVDEKPAEPIATLAPIVDEKLAEPIPTLDLELTPEPAEVPPTLEPEVLELDGLAAVPPTAETNTEPPKKMDPEQEASEPGRDTSDPFGVFVRALVDVALGAGATRAAATIPSLMDGGAVNFDSFSDDVRALLLAAKFAEMTDGGMRIAAGFVETAAAWRSVLRGETNDLSGCGTSTLDGWGVDVLKAFGVGRDGKIDARRELRRRGVAAFGMLLAA